MMKELLFLCFLVISSGAVAQAQKVPDCGTKPKIEGTDSDCFKPVIYGKKDDGFPKEIKIKGIVTRVTLTHIACGVLCLWGTAEIKLLERPKGYDQEYLYVTVLCFSGKPEDYIGKVVNQKVIKSGERYYERLYCTLIYNFLDSQGKPFYIPYEKGRRLQYTLKIVGDNDAQKKDVLKK